MKASEPIYVTRPFLPPLEEFNEYLEQIWESKKLTNKGPYHELFEKKLAEYLNVKYISLFSNGTLALISALQALRITGEVITTPFSFVATTHALNWNGIKPVFCDVDPATYNLDPKKIEAAITPRTTAILPVHVYGNPCDVTAIQEIAGTYGLKVIYDACHAFGVTLDGNSILNFGDLSVLSFHATKVFTTFEGGAIICHDETTKKRIDFLKNFGFAGETTVVAPGINAKMNEFQAALGVLQLKYVGQCIQKRKDIVTLYRHNLRDVPGITYLEDIPLVGHNYAHFPILIDKDIFDKSRDDVYNALKNRNIFTRRYFYPLISQFPTYRGLESANSNNLPVAEDITQKVLCLPIYPDLDLDIALNIVKEIKIN
ncbi:MAG: DegT/DnrJ/EryC1/StrS family aminotransferase [Deltaproteobacteria bacterium]|nr:DegT/DnrJ/EryC1/StrS family aminotransferase [Deltaproteobacteria bacterium]